jgi:copper chaperone CopZ
MVNKNFYPGILMMIFGILAVGCGGTFGKVTVVSTKNIDWNRASEYVPGDQHIKGEDVYHIIICWPTKESITTENAINNALQKIPGAIALVDVTFKERLFIIPFIYGKEGYYIEGTVLIDPKLALTDKEESTDYLVFYTEDGKDFKKTAVSEAEYLSYVK